MTLRHRFLAVTLALLLLVILTGLARKAQAQGKVCADPGHACGDFKPHELSFKIAKKFNFDRPEDKSAPFYAVILRSGELCKMTEEERLKTQALFPGNKVFLHRYFCEDFNDKVTYTNINKKFGFIAVYAGETPAAAQKFLSQVKATGLFPDANLRRMQVVVTYQLE
jgi:hypothetical protein